MENIKFPLFPITNIWQHLLLMIISMSMIYFVAVEQFGHFLYWKNWKKSFFLPFLIFPRKKRKSVFLTTKKSKHFYLIIILIFFILLGISVGVWFLSSFLGGLVFFIALGTSLFGLRINNKFKQKKELIKQFPFFLQTLENTLKAGYSFEKALVFVANETEEPLKKELLNINRKITFHISLPVALADFSQKINHPDITFFVESTTIQLKTGGNLIDLFQKVSHFLEEKNELSRNIKSFTAQGKMSGILIASLWPISLVLFYFLSPKHTFILFHTFFGQSLLIVSFCLEWLGFFFIWKIIRIKL